MARTVTFGRLFRRVGDSASTNSIPRRNAGRRYVTRNPTARVQRRPNVRRAGHQPVKLVRSFDRLERASYSTCVLGCAASRLDPSAAIGVRFSGNGLNHDWLCGDRIQVRQIEAFEPQLFHLLGQDFQVGLAVAISGQRPF
jgi:hypothetical protein